MLLLYVAVILIGIVMVVFSGDIAADDPSSDAGEVAVIGVVYAVLGLGMSALFAVGFFWRKGNGAWIYQIILIVLGMTSCCTWPATIPLLIYWVKDRDRIIQS